MSDRVFSSEEKAKLTQLVNEGITVMQEVDDLNEGFKKALCSINQGDPWRKFLLLKNYLSSDESILN